MFRYVLHSLRASSEKYGVCEVCHIKVLGEMYYQKELQDYKHGWTSAYCQDYFGHKECLEKKQREPKEKEL